MPPIGNHCDLADRFPGQVFYLFAHDASMGLLRVLILWQIVGLPVFLSGGDVCMCVCVCVCMHAHSMTSTSFVYMVVFAPGIYFKFVWSCGLFACFSVWWLL